MRRFRSLCARRKSVAGTQAATLRRSLLDAEREEGIVEEGEAPVRISERMVRAWASWPSWR